MFISKITLPKTVYIITKFRLINCVLCCTIGTTKPSFLIILCISFKIHHLSGLDFKLHKNLKIKKEFFLIFTSVFWKILYNVYLCEYHQQKIALLSRGEDASKWKLNGPFYWLILLLCRNRIFANSTKTLSNLQMI